jgi:acyl-CoA-binding protein
MDVTERFEAAQVSVTALAQDPGNDVKLRLYALYKQATAGDAGDKRPSRFDVVGRAKHDAWAAVRGMSPDDAKVAYADLVDQLLAGEG